ncbi:MAG TPA: DUF1203 domain-containing protein [Burkholderiales bacterium]|jgi:hypothetical protein|nr:DUF1203 domain-containing protein [Burkholderiales bacterium]
MNFRFVGIPEAVAREVRETMHAPDYGHPAHQTVAQGYGPCRLCLRTFRVGVDERILFTYNPFPEGDLPAPGPVFIHAGSCARYDAAEFPADLRALPMVLEGYRSSGERVTQERVAGSAVEARLERILRDGADYVHIRNGEVGCFMARVENTNR